MASPYIKRKSKGVSVVTPDGTENRMASMADATTQDFYNTNHDSAGRFTHGKSFKSSGTPSAAVALGAKAFKAKKYAEAATHYSNAAHGSSGIGRATRAAEQAHGAHMLAGKAAEAAGQHAHAADHYRNAETLHRQYNLQNMDNASAAHRRAKAASKGQYRSALAPLIAGAEEMTMTDNVEEFFNPYHGPDGRFTSGGGKSLRRNLAQLKSNKAQVRSNAAEAGHAKRKGDSASLAKNAHATKIAKGRAGAAMERIRAQRVAQIKTAKRQLKSNTMAAVPTKKQLDKHSDAVKAAALKRSAAAKAATAKVTAKPVEKSSPAEVAKKPAQVSAYDRALVAPQHKVGGKKHADAVSVVANHKAAKGTATKADDGPAARALAKMRQKQIASAKKKARVMREPAALVRSGKG